MQLKSGGYKRVRTSETDDYDAPPSRGSVHRRRFDWAKSSLVGSVLQSPMGWLFLFLSGCMVYMIFRYDGENNILDASHRMDSTHSAHNISLWAWYYPQFYPEPDNIKRYGEGYSEWTLIKAAPDENKNSVKIQKPIEPLGYYDLRDIQPRKIQGDLARKHGIDGFIYYHYWMEDRPIMGEILERMLRDGEPNMPFAFCWVLNNMKDTMYNPLTGEYGNGDEFLTTTIMPYEKHWAWLKPFFESDRYLKIDGKPAFFIYHHNPMGLSKTWRQELTTFKDTVGSLLPNGIHFVKCLNWVDEYEVDAWADSVIEFHPHTFMYTRTVHSTTMPRCAFKELREEQTLHRGVQVFWDDSPRYPDGRQLPSFYPPNPKKFEDMVVEKMCKTLCTQRNSEFTIISIFAWNEWGEGATMEPSSVAGDGMLKALKNAKERFLEMDCTPECQELRKMESQCSSHNLMTEWNRKVIEMDVKSGSLHMKGRVDEAEKRMRERQQCKDEKSFLTRRPKNKDDECNTRHQIDDPFFAKMWGDTKRWDEWEKDLRKFGW